MLATMGEGRPRWIPGRSEPRGEPDHVQPRARVNNPHCLPMQPLSGRVGTRQVGTAATDLPVRRVRRLWPSIPRSSAMDSVAKDGPRCRSHGDPTTSRCAPRVAMDGNGRSEEHTSELQSRENLVCRLLLEKKKK